MAVAVSVGKMICKRGVLEALGTGKASPFYLATRVFLSSLVQRSRGGTGVWINSPWHTGGITLHVSCVVYVQGPQKAGNESFQSSVGVYLALLRSLGSEQRSPRDG